jgi:hypothetical protein
MVLSDGIARYSVENRTDVVTLLAYFAKILLKWRPTCPIKMLTELIIIITMPDMAFPLSCCMASPSIIVSGGTRPTT